MPIIIPLAHKKIIIFCIWINYMWLHKEMQRRVLLTSQTVRILKTSACSSQRYAMNLFLFMHQSSQQEFAVQVILFRTKPVTLTQWFLFLVHTSFYVEAQYELQTSMKDGLLRKKAAPGVFILIWHNTTASFVLKAG